MNHIILLILFTSAVCPFGRLVRAKEAEGIVNGFEAPVGKLKYQVSVQANGISVCGGGILSNMLIATVAHCVINQRAARFYEDHLTVVATTNVHNKSLTISSDEVEKVYLPKTFNLYVYQVKTVFKTDEDFAILKLKDGLGLATNSLLKKLTILQSFSFRIRNTFVIAGYGTNYLINNSTGTFDKNDGKLRYADVKILSNDECSQVYKTRIHSSHLCARVKQGSDKPRGTCRGDGGSPLVKNNKVLIGVHSVCPISCSESVLPGIYINIAYHSKLINDALSGNITSNMRVFSQIQLTALKYAFVEE